MSSALNRPPTFCKSCVPSQLRRPWERRYSSGLYDQSQQMRLQNIVGTLYPSKADDPFVVYSGNYMGDRGTL